MILQEQNKALRIVGNAASANAAWQHYAAFCFAREKGMKKNASQALDLFLTSAAAWSTEEKLQFVQFIFPLFETVEEADHGSFPQPLRERLVKPTLLAWCEAEADDPRPFRWFGIYFKSDTHLYKALKIDPSDDRSREVLLTRIAERLYHSFHHLPHGYIGEPQQDLALIAHANELAKMLVNDQQRKLWMAGLEADLALVNSYLDWLNSGHSNFEHWATANKRALNYGDACYNFEAGKT